MKKIMITLLLVLGLLFSMIIGVFLIKSGFAQFATVITIKADGSIEPSTTFISTIDKITYNLMSNAQITIDNQRSNIILDGCGFTLQGSGDFGFWLDNVKNVTIRNFTITGFNWAIYSYNSSYNQIYRNNLLSNSGDGIEFLYDSTHNFIYDNNITDNGNGILLSSSVNLNPNDSSLPGSNYNEIYLNNIQSNSNDGILIEYSSYNKIYNNTIINNGYCGVCLATSSNNEFYLNKLVNNTSNAKVGGKVGSWEFAGVGELGSNVWDNGKVGNYWSDYLTKYSNASEIDSSGIGDTSYVIDVDNIDHFPLILLKLPDSTIDKLPEPQTENEAFPIIPVTASVGIVAIVCVSLLFYFKKHKH